VDDPGVKRRRKHTDFDVLVRPVSTGDVGRSDEVSGSVGNRGLECDAKVYFGFVYELA
jgi:hypothetical protein